MKKPQIKRAPVLLFFLVISVTGFSQKNPGPLTHTDCPIDYTNETKLVLETHSLSVIDGGNERTTFTHSVSTTQTQTLEQPHKEIPYSSFCTLKKRANEISHTCSTGSLTAFRLKYGLNTAKTQLQLVYQPIVLCLSATRDTIINNVTHKLGLFTLSAVGLNYTLTPAGTFSQAANTHTAEICGRYQSDIRFIKVAGSTPVNFATGDAEWCTYTFQEVEQLTTQNSGSTTVKIWNSYKEFTHNQVTAFRHSLFLGPSGLNILSGNMRLFAGYAGAFADRTNLCPPGCERFLYFIIN